MNNEERKAALEAIIYAADEPATIEQLTAALGEEKLAVQSALDELVASYAAEERGIEIRAVAGGYKMYTKPQHDDVVRRFIKSLRPPLRLSMPALETLAVIAYKQPVTAPEISDIRGVNTSGVISTLLDKKLITTAGRKEVMGRPILYKTSKEFLMRFGLSDLDELPSLKEFEALAREALGTDEGIAHGVVTEEQVAELHPEVDAAHAAVAMDRHSHASPAVVVFTLGGGGSSSNWPLGIPSAVARASCSRNSSASESSFSTCSIASSAEWCDFFFSSRRRHTRYWRGWSSDVCSSVTSPCAIPSSVPSASRANASNSFKLGNSSKSLNPNRIKNSFDVLYKIGRPITSLRPAVVISFLSSSVEITPDVFTPRISEISGAVTGCLYAITASVSSAGIERRNGGRSDLINRRTTS